VDGMVGLKCHASALESRKSSRCEDFLIVRKGRAGSGAGETSFIGNGQSVDGWYATSTNRTLLVLRSFC